ncbi:MAG: Dockerin type domain, partial [Planctomycetota bacterium]
AQEGQITLSSPASIWVPIRRLVGIGLLTPGNGGLIDLGVGGLEIAAEGISAEDLRAGILAGRGDGGWNGTSGISSTAASTAGGARAVGYVVAPDGTSRVSFTAPGDTDLDGVVNVFDLVAVNGSGTYGRGAPADWNDGDFNYDGVTNVFDLVSVGSAAVYGQGRFLPSESAAAARAVPEPGGVAIGVGSLLVAIWGSRRRPAA